jgi:hypothetical protein
VSASAVRNEFGQATALSVTFSMGFRSELNYNCGRV